MLTLLKIFCIGGNNIKDAVTDGGIRDQASARRQHTTARGDEVASFFHACRETPQGSATSRHVQQQRATFCPNRHARAFCAGPLVPNAGLQEPLKTILLGDGTLWRFRWLQESSDFLQHEDTIRQFHVAHCRGCAALSNKHTFEPDLQVKSVYVPADTAYCSGWAFEALLSSARFRRIPRNGKSSFTTKSLHYQNAVEKKRSIALNIFLAVRSAMIHEDVDMVAGDFTGESWRRKTRPLKNARLCVPSWGPGGISKRVD